MRQQSIGLAGDRIALRQIKEREQRSREERQAVRLCKSCIEVPTAGRSSNVGDDAVEYPPALLISVESLVQELAKKASAL